MTVSVTTVCEGCQCNFSCAVREAETLRPGQECVIETGQGVFMAKVRQVIPFLCRREKKGGCDCKLLRKATPEDLKKYKNNSGLEKKAFSFCQQRVQARKLPMKLVGVQYLLDGSKAVFYFTADGRVDFRELVRDLAYELRTRIEMKQIGVRDEAKIMGGYGSCGLQLCCASFLKDFEPVSIRMAKVQNLTLDPTKISGVCGRLMCCLGYEHRDYDKMRKVMPKPGEYVSAEGKSGKVVNTDMIKELVFVQFEEGVIKKYSLVQVTRKKDERRQQKSRGKEPPQEQKRKN